MAAKEKIKGLKNPKKLKPTKPLRHQPQPTPY
jgi:hypothetical protein